MDNSLEKSGMKSSSWHIDHWGIRVPDLDAAIAWYTKTLDLRVTKSWPIGDLTVVFFAPADSESFTFEVMAGPGATSKAPFENLVDSLARDGLHHIAFQVEDVDAVIEDLRGRGARIVNEPGIVEATGQRFAFFADPWGNLFEVTTKFQA